MVDINPIKSITTLNINDLYVPVKQAYQGLPEVCVWLGRRMREISWWW